MRTDWDTRIAGVSAFLLVAALLMVGAGFALPSAPAAEGAPYRPMSAPARPIRLVVPALHLRAPIVPIEVNAQQVLDPPADTHEVGWWRRSAKPGAEQGQTVLTGHTVHTGGGVMNDLGKLERGQLVKVVTPKGAMVYRTTRVQTLSKEQLAKRAVGLFGQDRDPVRLVLITCTDWDGAAYRSNIVAFAKPLGVATKAARHRNAKARS